MALADLEMRTQELGRKLFAEIGRGRPVIGSAAWWDEQLMAMSMRDEQVKLQLFRFVDVLPALRSSAQVNRHIREYFEPVADRLPKGLGPLVRRVPDNGRMGSWVSRLARFNAERLARRFIAGSDLADTLRGLHGLRQRRMAFTIDLLGEAVLSEREASQYQAEYLRFIDGLAEEAARWPADALLDGSGEGPIPRVNVSVKLSSLYSQFDPMDPVGTSRAVREKLRPILRRARERGAFVNVDMEQRAYKDATLRIVREILEEEEFRDWADAGVVIQMYLRESMGDLESLLEWVKRRGRPLWVRLVKGAYWDYETVVAAQQGWPAPVFTDKAETDASYERGTAFLMEHREWLRPAIASHNVRSIAHAMALAEAYEVPPGGIEFQALYGMADALKDALVGMGQRVRVYTPFGQLLPGMGYLVRRLLENTSNQSFLRAGFLERAPVEQLLMNPLDLLRRRRETVVSIPARGEARTPRWMRPFTNEALADFSREESRSAMEKALGEVRGALGREYPIVIGGRRIAGGGRLESVNPSHSREVVGVCGRATAEQAREAIAAAKGAFEGWRDTAVEARAELLERAADVMRRRRYELAAWEVYECGKPWREADADVAEAIDYCDYYAREMVRLARPARRDVPGEENVNFPEPRGVAVVIAPWNFPLAILCGMSSAALAAGNTVVMKPAEQSAVMGAKLMEVLEEAGAPAGVVNYLPGVGEEIGPALVGHPDVAVVAFTGSRAVGLGINRLAAEVPEGQCHIKHVLTELGGKNAIIVDEDADLDEALHGVAASAFGYSGQKCSACSRAIVLDAVYDAFVERLVEVTRSLRVGPAEEAGTFVGPVIDGEARDRIQRYIEIGRGEGRVVYAGELGALAGEGFYVAPHIIADVGPEARIAQEEIFGPVLAVMRARDLTEALRIANGTQYALTGGVYSRSPSTLERVRRELRVGNLYINRKITGALVDRQPFGGFKLSGGGTKAGGPEYLLHFVVQRTVTENTLRRGFAPAGEASSAAAAAGE